MRLSWRCSNLTYQDWNQKKKKTSVKEMRLVKQDADKKCLLSGQRFVTIHQLYFFFYTYRKSFLCITYLHSFLVYDAMHDHFLFNERRSF
jgi:hypothetical protein